MRSKWLWVYSSKDEQGVDIRVQTIEEIFAEATLLALVEMISVEQVVFSGTCDANAHHPLPADARIRALASLHGLADSLPSFNLRARSISTPSCQSGDADTEESS